MTRHGLFVGLATLDLIYLTAGFPEKNQKIVASDDTIAAGGPATNAAVTFSHLGNQATLLGIVGNHPISHLIRGDLKAYSVRVLDLEPHRSESPPVSSIIITQSTGDRAVISLNATKSQGAADQVPLDILHSVEIVLIDGHQIAVSQAIAQQAKGSNIPVVIDGGSWKPGLETVLPFVDYAICSANFYPPDCHNQKDVFAYLKEAGIAHIAITHGEKPIQYLSQGNTGKLEVPTIQAVDTLGAGDIFHGAFCHYILQQQFINALSAAAKIASRSCQFFGTRQWMQ
ncbi:MAG: sugar kinase [Xenococcaceae cyanobacterium]